MSRRARRPGMMDVADLAGVSHQTVSRVVNGHSGVRPETRERVLSAIRELGYRRNRAARALKTNRTQTIGVVAFGTTFHGPASTLDAIHRAARQASYFVTVATLDRITADTVADALDILSEQHPDGIILLVPERAVLEALPRLDPGMPTVSLDGGEGTLETPVVCLDQEAGAELATAHLLGLGHPTVHHLAGPSDWLAAEERVAGWRRCLEAAGASVPEPLRGDWGPRSGYDAGRELSGRPDVTAVFVANDQMALGLLRAYRDAGLRVPEDVSVVGFDNLPEAEFFAPPLTTVARDSGEIGQQAIRVLLDIVQGGRPRSRRVTISPSLVIRASTAPRVRPPLMEIPRPHPDGIPQSPLDKGGVTRERE